MTRTIRGGLALAVLIATAESASAAFVAYSISDAAPSTFPGFFAPRQVHIRDLNTGAETLWQPTIFGAITDVACDPLTGELYALTSGGLRRRNVDNSSTTASSISAAAHSGGDIDVFGSLVAYSATDADPVVLPVLLSPRLVLIHDLTTGVETEWHPTGSLGSISDVAFDPLTGELYALTTSGVRRRNADNSSTTVANVTASPDSGGDIDVFGNMLAFSPTDASPSAIPGMFLSRKVFLLDLATGTETEWDPTNGVGSISDVAFDPLTGELYALTRSGLYRRNPDNSSLLVANIFPAADSGADFTFVFPTPVGLSPVPEPGSLALLASGVLGLACGAVRRRREAQPRSG